MKLEAVIALAAVALFVAGGLYWAIREDGAQSVRTEVVNEREKANVRASDANLRGRDASSANTDDLVRRIQQLEQEAANARDEFAAFQNVEPAPGRVGAGALVDPAFGHAVVCRLQRLRGDPETACDYRAGESVERDAALEPVPARAAP